MPKGNRGGKGAVRPSADGVITATKKTTFEMDYAPDYDPKEYDYAAAYIATSDGNGTLYLSPAQPIELGMRKNWGYGDAYLNSKFSMQAGWISGESDFDGGEFFGLDLTKAKRVVIANAEPGIRRKIDDRMEAAGLYWDYDEKAYISRRGYYYSWKADAWLPSKYEKKYKNAMKNSDLRK